MQFVKARLRKILAAGKQAIASGAYIYPFRGIQYFITHSALHKPLYDVALPSLVLSLGVLISVFGLLYVPQAAALAIVDGPVAFVNAALLCLNESAVIINTISRPFLLDDALLAVFDATLLERDLPNLVLQGRELEHPDSTTKTSLSKLGKTITKPLARFSPAAIVDYFILLPLNAIPVLGTATFLIAQGVKSGPRAHARYFNLKQFTDKQRTQFVKDHQGAYTAFGTAASILSVIPFFSIPIQFTNTVGAALWAADMERSRDALLNKSASE